MTDAVVILASWSAWCRRPAAVALAIIAIPWAVGAEVMCGFGNVLRHARWHAVEEWAQVRFVWRGGR